MGDTKPQKVFMAMRACHHAKPHGVTDKGKGQTWHVEHRRCFPQTGRCR